MENVKKKFQILYIIPCRRVIVEWMLQKYCRTSHRSLLTLSNIHIYFIYLLRILRVVRLRLEKIQRDFLWGGGALKEAL